MTKPHLKNLNLKIRFKEPTQLEVLTGFDFDGDPTVEPRVFQIGSVVEVKTIETNDNYNTATIQFDDGTVAYGVPTNCFDVIDF